jgi:thiol-disulfide isomerase/thioredoxin/sugar lactone lactonase YvrE
MSSLAPIRAPDLDLPGVEWLNVARPLTLAALRGRLVILDFWTLGCINCLHTLETLRGIEEAFPHDVVVIGVHSPKFSAERELDSVRNALIRYRVTHPVAHDPRRQLWDRYAVTAWPTLVFLSPDGYVIAEQRGEPDPQALREQVAQLLETGRPAPAAKRTPVELRLEEATDGRFRYPSKVKALPGVRQRWAVADTGHNQIVLLEDDGSEIARFGDGQPGFRDGAGGESRFDAPQGLVCSTDTIYVADTGNHAIRRIDVGQRAVRTIAGTGRRGLALAGPRLARQTALASPWDLELDGAQLFIANAGTHQIVSLDLKRGRLSALAGAGHEGLIDGPAAESALAQPSGLVLDDGGETLYFVDCESSSVRAVTLDGVPRVTTLAGHGLFDFGHVNGTFGKALLQHPLGLTWCEGTLLVADSYNDTIRRLDLREESVTELDDGFVCEDALCLPLAEPAGIWADGLNRVLVADTNNHRVLEYSVRERRYRTWGS